MSYDYDFAVFIGRFQPFHQGHLHVVRAGLNRAERMVLLLGSAWQPRNSRNPWTHEERETMIRQCFSEAENRRIVCMPLMDVPYNDEAWVRNVQTTVAGVVTAHYPKPHRRARIALIGHHKDHTGFYLSLFPHWESIAVENCNQLSATPLRERYFGGEGAKEVRRWRQDDWIPEGTAAFLEQFAEEEAGYHQIRDEMRFIERYQRAWESAPYTPTFVTVDAVVVQSGHILLVQRRAQPGKGLWALPGGFVGPDERVREACLRELREETRIKVPEPVLKGSISCTGVYDEPHRSARGRTITHAFYIELEPRNELPQVKGGDDARHARWVPLGELDPQTLFEDHYFIIQDLIGAA